MKKKYLLYALTLFGSLTLASCGRIPQDAGKELNATIRVIHDETVVSFTSTLDVNEKHSEDDKGSFVFETQPNYYIKKVKQNGIADIHRDKDNKFKFNYSLLEGENTFEVTTYFRENEFNDSGILEGPNNVPDFHGNMSDNVDPIPVPGGLPLPPLPEYENGKEIYFIDAPWWNKDGASTNILCYDASKNLINTTDATLGTPMRHVEYKQEDKVNVFKWIIDMDKTAFVKFTRTGNGGVADWGAKTDFLEIQDPYKDAYQLEFKAGFGEGKTSGRWTNLAEYEPFEPLPSDVYTLYFRPTAQFQSKLLANPNLKVGIHKFGGIGNDTTWPGIEMEKVADNLYKDASFDKNENSLCKFTLIDNGAAVSEYPQGMGKDLEVDWSKANSKKEIIFDGITEKFYTYEGVDKLPDAPEIEPEVPQEGTYKLYVDLDSSLIEGLKTEGTHLNIYLMGKQEMGWPGVAMTKVNDTTYSYDVDSATYDKCKFTVVDGSNNVKVEYPNGYGKDITIDYSKANENKELLIKGTECFPYDPNGTPTPTPDPKPDTPKEPATAGTYYIGAPKWYKDASAIIECTLTKVDGSTEKVTIEEVDEDKDNFIFKVIIPENVVSMKLTRLNPADKSVWNESPVITFADHKGSNIFYIGGDNKIYGNTYTPKTPAEPGK